MYHPSKAAPRPSLQGPSRRMWVLNPPPSRYHVAGATRLKDALGVQSSLVEPRQRLPCYQPLPIHSWTHPSVLHCTPFTARCVVGTWGTEVCNTGAVCTLKYTGCGQRGDSVQLAEMSEEAVKPAQKEGLPRHDSLEASTTWRGGESVSSHGVDAMWCESLLKAAWPDQRAVSRTANT